MTNLFSYLAVRGHPAVPKNVLPIDPSTLDTDTLQDMQRTYLSEMLSAVATLAPLTQHGANLPAPVDGVPAAAPMLQAQPTSAPIFRSASAQRDHGASQSRFPPGSSASPAPLSAASMNKELIYVQDPAPRHVLNPQPQAHDYPPSVPAFLPSSAAPSAYKQAVLTSGPAQAAPTPVLPAHSQHSAAGPIAGPASGQPQFIAQPMPSAQAQAHAAAQTSPASNEAAQPRSKKKSGLRKLMKKLNLSKRSSTASTARKATSESSAQPNTEEFDSWDSHSESAVPAKRTQPAHEPGQGHDSFSEENKDAPAPAPPQGSAEHLGAAALASIFSDDDIACTRDDLLEVLRDAPNAKAKKLAPIARMLNLIDGSLLATPAVLAEEGMTVWRQHGWSTRELLVALAYLRKTTPGTCAANLLARLIQDEIAKYK